jgi:hypothetical protein
VNELAHSRTDDQHWRLAGAAQATRRVVADWD